jgi:hypothetical protein
MFQLTHKGFTITYANGITVSVQWGEGNYCERRDKPDTSPHLMTSGSAEVLAWDKDRNDLEPAQGWIEADQLPFLLEKYRTWDFKN